MRRDPMITYGMLIPGGLHYVPGGLNLPRQPTRQVDDTGRDLSVSGRRAVDAAALGIVPYARRVLDRSIHSICGLARHFRPVLGQ